MRDTSRLRRARISGGRAGALEAEPATPLVWVGGAQAALCGTAALVAVIALLNGTAGARAVSVFTWAIIFALIAGTGAGLGHLAWRMKRARLATLTLLLSQLGLLAWMLGLLGARPAMMLLVPFGMALALRGLGRAAAVITGLAALALYALTFALGLAGVFAPAITLPASVAATLDIVFVGIGLALTAMMLASLYAAGERERARTRAIERAARLSAIELDALRMRTEDDAETLRRALSAALRGAPTEVVRAEGALSPLAEQVNAVAERLVDLSYDREERKRLESATRRLIRNIERAWLGLSWSWPEASGVILDDLIALLRTPPPSEPDATAGRHDPHRPGGGAAPLPRLAAGRLHPLAATRAATRPLAQPFSRPPSRRVYGQTSGRASRNLLHPARTRWRFPRPHAGAAQRVRRSR